MAPTLTTRGSEMNNTSQINFLLKECDRLSSHVADLQHRLSKMEVLVAGMKARYDSDLNRLMFLEENLVMGDWLKVSVDASTGVQKKVPIGKVVEQLIKHFRLEWVPPGDGRFESRL